MEQVADQVTDRSGHRQIRSQTDQIADRSDISNSFFDLDRFTYRSRQVHPLKSDNYVFQTIL